VKYMPHAFKYSAPGSVSANHKKCLTLRLIT
jgi:hypothetical protein